MSEANMSRYFVNALRSVKTKCLAHLPGLCAGCGQLDGSRICEDCIFRFIPPVPRCPRCAIGCASDALICGTCLRDPPFFDAGRAAVDYAFPWARLITQFKFHEGLDLADSFVDLMLKNGPPLNGSSSSLILPVPLGKARIRQRGFNQSWELARRLAQRLDWPSRSDFLLKTRDTPEQMSLPLHGRASNLKGVFALAAKAREFLEGQHVILVDDVMTTGATMNILARLLKEAGAASVGVWIFARTPPPHSVSL
jgi:ComF family protein